MHHTHTHSLETIFFHTRWAALTSACIANSKRSFLFTLLRATQWPFNSLVVVVVILFLFGIYYCQKALNAIIGFDWIAVTDAHYSCMQTYAQWTRITWIGFENIRRQLRDVIDSTSASVQFIEIDFSSLVGIGMKIVKIENQFDHWRTEKKTPQLTSSRPAINSEHWRYRSSGETFAAFAWTSSIFNERVHVRSLSPKLFSSHFHSYDRIIQ